MHKRKTPTIDNTVRLLAAAWLLVTIGVCMLGCGSTKSRLATEQLLVSDAIDDAIAAIDFRTLAGEKVFFDTRYLVNVKGIGFVNAEYVISSLRQQMIAADLRLQDKAEEADFIVEARVGTLGTDGDEIVYGIPANRGLSDAATLIPNAPALPAIPEISLARKESQVGAVKIATYAFDRRTGEPIWQSGIARAKTSSQDIWLFGAGPFQQGSIHGHTKFAGTELRFPGDKQPAELAGGPPVPFSNEYYFQSPAEPAKSAPLLSQRPPRELPIDDSVQQASHMEPARLAQPPTNPTVPKPPAANVPIMNVPVTNPPVLSAPNTLPTDPPRLPIMNQVLPIPSDPNQMNPSTMQPQPSSGS